MEWSSGHQRQSSMNTTRRACRLLDSVLCCTLAASRAPALLPSTQSGTAAPSPPTHTHLPGGWRVNESRAFSRQSVVSVTLVSPVKPLRLLSHVTGLGSPVPELLSSNIVVSTCTISCARESQQSGDVT